MRKHARRNLHQGPIAQRPSLGIRKTEPRYAIFSLLQSHNIFVLRLSPSAAGDRIRSLTISFEHMVYEDALTILSYASPYEVIIEVQSGKILGHNVSGQGAQPVHPLYRSSSNGDLVQVGIMENPLHVVLVLQ